MDSTYKRKIHYTLNVSIFRSNISDEKFPSNHFVDYDLLLNVSADLVTWSPEPNVK